jgi:hypothetical protein
MGLGEVMEGLFHGAIPVEPGVPAVYDGVLQVADGSLVTAWYSDEDNGSGGGVVISDTTMIDCQPPAFDGLASGAAGPGCVELDWGAAFDASGAVTYNVYREGGPGGARQSVANTWALFYADCDVQPGAEYRYLVRAVDAVGNEDGNTVELPVAMHGIYLPLLQKE